jgi:hypothetical protein
MDQPVIYVERQPVLNNITLREDRHAEAMDVQRAAVSGRAKGVGSL